MRSVRIALTAGSFDSRAALHMASANGHADIVEKLLLAGADATIGNAEKNTPLVRTRRGPRIH